MMVDFLSFLFRYGLFATIKFNYYKILTRNYNKKFNLETSGVSLETIYKTNVPDNINHITGTESILVPLIRKVFDSIRISSDDIFVDFGCSQGRALLIASEYNFKKVIGIEFLSDICITAEKNINNYKKTSKTKTNISLMKSDVLDYKFLGDENFFYFFNPFDCQQMLRLMKNIENSVKKNPRLVRIIYVSPRCHDTLIDFNFTVIKKINLINKNCYVYVNEPYNT